MARKAKSVDDRQQTFGNEDDFYLDPHGQMTINRIDSPIGLKCQELIKAEMKVEEAREELEFCRKTFAKLMHDNNLKKITVLGKKVLYKEAKLTEAKIVIKGESE